MYDEQQERPQNTQASVVASQLKRQNDHNALLIRLDTEDLISKIKEFLTGQILHVYQDETGRIVESVKNIGEPKANAVGVQTILNRVSTIVNPSTVQGNFSSDNAGYSEQYTDYIMRFDLSLLDQIVDNCYEWQIQDENILGIRDFICFLVDAFLTRLIDNKERESYGESLRTVEQTTNTQKGGSFRLPIMGGGR